MRRWIAGLTMSGFVWASRRENDPEEDHLAELARYAPERTERAYDALRQACG